MIAEEPNGQATEPPVIDFEHSEKLAKRLQLWGGLTVGIFMAGVMTILFLSAKFAAARDVERIIATQSASSQEFNRHVITEAAKMGALEAQARDIEEDYHAIRDQLWKIADRIGAQKVAAPVHTRGE